MIQIILQNIFQRFRSLFISSLPSYTLEKLPVDFEGITNNSYLPDWYKLDLKNRKYSKEKYEGRRLYLINFNRHLAVFEALEEIYRLGFEPANLIETALFIKDKICCQRFYPIITIAAYSNPHKIIGNFPLCIDILNNRTIANPGEVEAGEIYEGLNFMTGTNFLVKEICVENRTHDCSREFREEIKKRVKKKQIQ